MNPALSKYNRIKDICKETVLNDDKFIVQVVKSTVEKMKNNTVFKCVLLDRKPLLDGSEVSAFNEILLMLWIDPLSDFTKEDGSNLYQDTMKYIKDTFKFGAIIELIKITHLIEPTKDRKNVAHDYSITITYEDRDTHIVTKYLTYELSGAERIIPVPFEDYAKYFPFHTTDLIVADGLVKGSDAHKPSFELAVFGKVYVKLPEKRTSCRFLNFSLMDHNGHIANFTAFREAVDVVTFEENDFVLLKGVNASIYQQKLSFTVNLSTMIIVNPMHNMTLQPLIKNIMAKSSNQYISDEMFLSSFRLKKSNAIYTRTLEQIQDENITLCDNKPMVKSHVKKISISNIDTQDMFKYQCTYINESTQMSCMKTVNPFFYLGNVRWCCTRKAPDNSLPLIPCFTDDEKRDKHFYGHICLQPSIKMYAKMTISDSTMNSMEVSISNNALEQLFKLNFKEIAALTSGELYNLTLDIIQDPDNCYYINTTSRYNVNSSKKFDNNYFFQIDYINKENVAN